MSHDVLSMSINLNNIAILNIQGIDYCCIINGIGKSGAVNLLQNADLTEGREELKKFKTFITTYKMSKEIITFGILKLKNRNFTNTKTLF